MDYQSYKQYRTKLQERLDKIVKRNKTVQNSLYDHLNDPDINDNYELGDNFVLPCESDFAEEATDVLYLEHTKEFRFGSSQYWDALTKAIPMNKELDNIVQGLKAIIDDRRNNSKKKTKTILKKEEELIDKLQNIVAELATRAYYGEKENKPTTGLCDRCTEQVRPIPCNQCYHNCKDWKCPNCGYCTFEMWKLARDLGMH